MKRAVVKQVRTTPDGRRVVNINCPQCSHRHWLPETNQPVRCPRKLGKAPFLIRLAAR